MEASGELLTRCFFPLTSAQGEGLQEGFTQDDEDEESPWEDCFTPRLNETGLEPFLVYFLA